MTAELTAEHEDDLERLLAPVLIVEDLEDRLAALRTAETELPAELRSRIRRAIAETILELRSRSPRPTWDEIGRSLGVSAQRAEQLSRIDD